MAAQYPGDDLLETYEQEVLRLQAAAEGIVFGRHLHEDPRTPRLDTSDLAAVGATRTPSPFEYIHPADRAALADLAI